MSRGRGREQFVRQPFVLPEDVLLFPATELDTQLQQSLSLSAGDYAISRPSHRTRSTIVSAGTAELLEEFRRPTPIVEAIGRYARRHELDVTETLEAAFPTLQHLSRAQMLVPAASNQAKGLVASLAPGQRLGEWTIRRIVRVLKDTEIYMATRADGAVAAIKVGRPDAGPSVGSPMMDVRRMLERERTLLQLLGGGPTPALLGHDTEGPAPWLAIEWIQGINIGMRARELRTDRRPGWSHRLLALAQRVCSAYADLHDAGVVHGDVHVGNIMVDATDRVVLLDLGLGRRSEGPGDEDRSGLPWSMDPALAAALLEGAALPRATSRSEQFAIGALLYEIMTGHPWVESSIERDAMLRSIISSPPVPLARRGVTGWESVERVLWRALAKAEDDRFPSVRALSEALAAATVREPARPSFGDSDASLALERALAALLERACDPDIEPAALFPLPPVPSLQYGAAGLAWVAYRASVAEDRIDLLEAAERWARIARSSSPSSYDVPEIGITPKRIGPCSLLHRRPGVLVVHGLIAHARGALSELAEDSDEYFSMPIEEGAPDLGFGDGGWLVGGALLLDAIEATDKLDASSARRALRLRLDAHLEGLARLPTIGRPSPLGHLGMAHGWAGTLLAQLIARQALGESIPQHVLVRLKQLVGLATPDGRGISWPGTVEHHGSDDETPAHAPGWCAGTAGHVQLLANAFEATQDERWLDVARDAAWHVWEHPDASGHLCCGRSGRGLALLRLYRLTGDPAWRDRAEAQRGPCVAWLRTMQEVRSNSLFWGELGPLLLALELRHPDPMSVPLMEREGWHGSAGG